MHPQRLADLAADRQHRIEARHRLLEDHRNVVAANSAHLAFGELQQILTLEANGTRDLARGLGNEPHQRHRGDRFAAAGFSDDRQRLTFVDMEGDAVDRPVDTLGRSKMGLQVLDFEQRHQIKTSSESRYALFLIMLYKLLAIRGSSASRRPSPSRLTASTVTDRNAAGKNTM